MLLFKKNRARKELIDKIKKEDLDLSSVFSAINDRTETDQLFKSLSRRCHPDGYIGYTEKVALAEEIFKQVMANSTNLEELKKLDDRIKTELES